MKEDSIKILYIEDDPPSRLLVKRLLNRPPFRYYDAATGMEGLRQCEEIRPDLILMDLILPDISGTELTTKIKSIPELRDIVIVAITGENTPEAREISLIAGCDGYIPKPIDARNFPAQILQFVEGQREEVSEERRESIRRRYEQTLVDHLTSKVKELEHSNRLLTERTKLLKNYSFKLELLLRVINNLQVCQTLSQLEEKLIDEIRTNLGFKRCIFFEPNFDKNLLKPIVVCDADKGRGNQADLKVNLPQLERAFGERRIVLFDKRSSSSKQLFLEVHLQLESDQFVLGVLGHPQRSDSTALMKQHGNELLSTVFSDVNGDANGDVEVIRDHLKEFLVSEVFTVGGYLFLDRHGFKQPLPSYDYGILEMLLQTASLIYQNLRLREQLKGLFVRAEKDAVTDYLTNLFNYRYFKQQLSREFDRAQRHNSKFVTLMIDIDHFKNYNDAYGHQAGDVVLKNLAEVLRRNTRSTDIVARYGGEEFVIVCPELDKKMGILLAEKLRKITADSILTKGDDLPEEKITISIGVAAYPDDADTPEELVSNADKALYKAKENGRNQVQGFGGDSDL